VILFGTVALIGINTLRQVDLGDRINCTIAASAVGIGLLPAFAPSMFERFPASAQILLGSGISVAAIVAFALNLLFNHTSLGTAARAHRSPRPEPDGVPSAVAPEVDQATR
jgi:NCS2 family nucleobase:cation symporter-2